MKKITKIFGDFVSLCQGLLPTSRHFENRRGEGRGDEVGEKFIYQLSAMFTCRDGKAGMLSSQAMKCYIHRVAR